MWQTLLAVIVGGVISLGGWIVQDELAARRRRNSLSAALAAEISSIVELVKRQRYAEELREVAHSMAGEMGIDMDYFVDVGSGYFTVYEANARILGELKPQIASKVVRFYQGARSLTDSFPVKRSAVVYPRGEKAKVYLEIADAIDELCSNGTDVAGELTNSA